MKRVMSLIKGDFLLKFAHGHDMKELFRAVSFSVIPPLLFSHDKKQTAKDMAFNLAIIPLTLGLPRKWQFAAQAAVPFATMAPALARGVIQGTRTSLDMRTSAAIPFSHSNIATDQAFAALQYANSRMNEATNSGSEAAFMAAKFTR